MSILTCTNVHPNNEAVMVDSGNVMTQEEYSDFILAHPEYADLPYEAGNANLTDIMFIKSPKASFTFNCSGGAGCLRFQLLTYTNVRTGETVKTCSPRFFKYTSGYEHNNGDTITYTMNGFNSSPIVKNGQEWQMQRILFQSDKSTLTGEMDTKPLFDMKFNNGTIAKLSNGNLKLNAGIRNLNNFMFMYVPKDNNGNLIHANTEWGFYGSGIDKDKYDNNTDGYRNNCYPVGGALIEISSYNQSTGKTTTQSGIILSYNKKTGEIVCQGNISTSQISEGDKFTIYTNYFIDKPYYFITRSDPKISIDTVTPMFSNYPNKNVEDKYYVSHNISVDSNNGKYICNTTVEGNFELNEEFVNTISHGYTLHSLHCKGSYKQSSISSSWNKISDYSGLKCYQFLLYDNDTGVLIDQSENIYDDALEYNFYLPMFNRNFKIVMKVTTQNNDVFAKSKTINLKNNNKNIISSNSTSIKMSTWHLGNVKLSWKFDNDFYGQYLIYRSEKLDDNEYGEYVPIYCSSRYNFKANTQYDFGDYTAGNHMTYKYAIQPIVIGNSDNENVWVINGTNAHFKNTIEYYNLVELSNGDEKEFTVDWGADSIVTSLKSTNLTWKKYGYRPVETWYFKTSPQDASITQNLGISLYDTTNGMPLITRTQKEYESGTFTIDLMQLSCPDNEIKDNISFVKKWTKFINGENDFLYKNPKGDVWIINVSGNPSRSYSYGSQYMETTVTYEWVQIIKTDDVVVL